MRFGEAMLARSYNLHHKLKQFGSRTITTMLHAVISIRWWASRCAPFEDLRAPHGELSRGDLTTSTTTFTIELRVSGVGGELCWITVPTCCSVQKVKEAIYHKLQIPIEEQKLVHGLDRVDDQVLGSLLSVAGLSASQVIDLTLYRQVQSVVIEGCTSQASLCKALAGQDQIHHLTLTSCPLRVLPPDLGNFLTLSQLTIEWCESLLYLPENIGNLQGLEQLTIEYCESLVALPDRCGDLQSLQRLVIRHCASLRHLPEQLASLQALQEFVLDHCGCLTSLPRQFHELQGLRRVKIEWCQNLAIPPQLSTDLRSLQWMSVFPAPDCDTSYEM